MPLRTIDMVMKLMNHLRMRNIPSECPKKMLYKYIRLMIGDEPCVTYRYMAFMRDMDIIRTIPAKKDCVLLNWDKIDELCGI